MIYIKAYQLKEHGGQWEDYYEYTIATYLSYEKAKEKFDELNQKSKEIEERNDKCQHCPWIWDWDEHGEEKLRERTNEYCDKAELTIEKFEDDDFEFVCKNYYENFYDIPSYRIEEIEIIE